MEERDFFHEICLTALSASKAVIFVGVVDNNNAKLIVGEYRKSNSSILQTSSKRNCRAADYCLLSRIFYLDYLMPLITKRGRKGTFCFEYSYTIKGEEDVHFDLTQINDNVKIATTPLTKCKDRYLCLYLDSSELHQEIIVTLSNSI